MIESSDLRMRRIPLNHGAGHMPALGFGALIPDAAVTITATRDALEAGFRHFDCPERYRHEREVGRALQAGLAAEFRPGQRLNDVVKTGIPGFIPQGR
jgi:alcohol dehydrogenase (NADP+)